MAASAQMSVLIVGLYLAIMCKFSFAHMQLEEQTENHVDASTVFTQMLGEFYEIKHENKLMAEKIRILEENQKSLETNTKGKFLYGSECHIAYSETSSNESNCSS